MKVLPLILLSFLSMSFVDWSSSFKDAKATAAKDHKFILLNFSGSDWCGPCIRLHKEIFASENFSAFAENSLVMVNADFPRQKKNQLEKSVQKQNDQLAERYNDKGIFPLTLLLDADGKIIKTWEGLPKELPEEFTNEVKTILNGAQ